MSKQFYNFVKKLPTISCKKSVLEYNTNTSIYVENFIDKLFQDAHDGNTKPLYRMLSLVLNISNELYYQFIPLKFLSEFATQLDNDPDLDKERQQKKQTIPVFFNQKYNGLLSDLGFIISNVELDNSELFKLAYENFIQNMDLDDNKLFALAAKEYYELSKDTTLLDKATTFTAQEVMDKIISRMLSYYTVSSIGEITHTLLNIILNKEEFTEEVLNAFHKFQNDLDIVLFGKPLKQYPIVESNKDKEENIVVKEPKTKINPSTLPTVLGCGLNKYVELFNTYRLRPIFKLLCDKLISRNETSVIRSIIRYHYNANYTFYSDAIVPNKFVPIVYDVGAQVTMESFEAYNNNRIQADAYLQEDFDNNIKIAAELMYKKIKETVLNRDNFYTVAPQFYDSHIMLGKLTPREAFNASFYDGAIVLTLFGLEIFATELIQKIKCKYSK